MNGGGPILPKTDCAVADGTSLDQIEQRATLLRDAPLHINQDLPERAAARARPRQKLKTTGCPPRLAFCQWRSNPLLSVVHTTNG
jgi:hypothetical protein